MARIPLTERGIVRPSRTTARILVTLALSGLVGVLAWWAADAFWVYQAKRGAHSVLLSHRAMQLYAMRPALYASKAKGAIAEELNSPAILSSSDIVREQHRVYNEARRQLGMAPVFYKMAADNPLNPANQADEHEERLISFFNTHREVNHYHAIVERQGKKFMYYVIPFLENTQACLHCHGNRADSPIRLQERYPGPGGFGERPGQIRAVESIVFPIDIEKRWTVVAAAMLLAVSFLLAVWCSPTAGYPVA